MVNKKKGEIKFFQRLSNFNFSKKKERDKNKKEKRRRKSAICLIITLFFLSPQLNISSTLFLIEKLVI